MGTIDELRAKQQARDEWYTIAAGLSGRFVDSLKRVRAEVDARTGLRLSWSGPALNVSYGEDSCHANDQPCLTLGAGAEYGIQLASFCFTIRRDSDKPGYWNLRVADIGKKLLELTTSTLWVPLRIFRPTRYRDPDFPFNEEKEGLEWIQYLWWRGPEDDAKLTSAFLDGFDKKERTSEFALEKVPRKGWLRFW